MVSCSDDMTCRVWNLETTHPLRVFSSHKRPYTSCDTKDDLVAMTTDMGTLFVYDIRSQFVLFETSLSSKPLTSCRFSSDGRLILVGGWDCEVKAVEIGSNAIFNSNDPHQDWITSVSTSPKYFASSGWDEKCLVYNYNDGQFSKKYTLQGHTNTITSCVMSKDSKQLATSSFDSTVKIWNLDNGREVKSIVGHKGRVNCVNFGTTNDKYIISGGEDRYVKFWDKNNGNIVNEFVCQGQVSSLHCEELGGNLSIVAGDKIGNIYFSNLIKPGSFL